MYERDDTGVAARRTRWGRALGSSLRTRNEEVWAGGPHPRVLGLGPKLLHGPTRRDARW